MTRDNPETVAMTDATAWQETAMPVGGEATPTVRVGREDLEAAVHGGVITGAQAKALWLRWSNPGQAARATGPGQRAMPEAAEEPSGSGGRGALTTVVLVIAAAAAAWVLRGVLRL